jgi:hypothetical protein
MEQDLTEFRVRRGEDIKISFPDPAQVAEVVVNGQRREGLFGSIVVAPPATDKKFSTLTVALDPARRTRPVEVQIQTDIGMFRHFVLPDLDLARFHFVFEESEQRLIYCAVEDDYVIAGPNGKCPRHP